MKKPGIVVKKGTAAEARTPQSSGKINIYPNENGVLCTKDSNEVSVAYLRPVDVRPETHFLIELAQDTAENLCVGFGGALPDAESAILGVNEAAALDEAEVYVRYSGIASVVLGADGAIVAGDKITTATDGKVKKATSEMYVIGIALTGGTLTNDIIQIRLGY